MLFPTAKAVFLKYKELLEEHIKKEDEILYPWIDRNLTISQIGIIFSKFEDIENNFGKDFFEKWEKFINGIKKEGTWKNLKDVLEVK